MIGDIGHGEMAITHADLDLVAAVMRSNHEGSHAAEVRHFEISPQPGMGKKAAWVLIQRIASDLRKDIAPDRPWLLGMDVNAKTIHGHLEISGIGLDGQPLKIGKREFRRITGLEFTNIAVSSKGRGRAKGVKVHPTAKRLDARDLAHILLTPEGRLSLGKWRTLRKQGAIDNVERRKKGGFTFSYRDRRIGSDTLLYFVDEEARRRRSMTKKVSLPSPALVPSPTGLATPPPAPPPIPPSTASDLQAPLLVADPPETPLPAIVPLPPPPQPDPPSTLDPLLPSAASAQPAPPLPTSPLEDPLAATAPSPSPQPPAPAHPPEPEPPEPSTPSASPAATVASPEELPPPDDLPTLS
jgi:hypothetical protein